ncbi:class I SAM-dependent methyltransferase [Actinoplanes sp. NPDC049118]|uniref:class I SAM-dependent methyltransferase n=1 Tax=Actinoplanes sp. NPDC049118 TaxID=3155769 RepID=UPI0033FDD246
MSDESFWDSRYAEQHHVWSGEPNVVLAREVDGLLPGRALDLGCGEGADAIWLAGRGWAVTAVDVSAVALDKAAARAAEAGVTVDFQRHDLAASFPAGSYDLVSAQFLYSRAGMPRERVLRSAAAAVAPGGILLIEGHQDLGPFAARSLEHGDVHFPEPDEVVAALELPEGEWEVLLSEAHDRLQEGPDGRPAHRTDGTVKVRRRPRRGSGCR